MPDRFAAAGHPWRQRVAFAACSLMAHGVLLALAVLWSPDGAVLVGKAPPHLARFALSAASHRHPPDAGPSPRTKVRHKVASPEQPRADEGRGIAPVMQQAPPELSVQLPSPTAPLIAHPKATSAEPPLAAAEKAQASTQQADYARHVWLRIMACRPVGIAIEGQVRLGFDLDRRGHLTGASVIRPSGVSLLDRAALHALRRAAPFPMPPDGSTADTLHFQVDVLFGSTN